jgi:hypothetical protein
MKWLLVSWILSGCGGVLFAPLMELPHEQVPARIEDPHVFINDSADNSASAEEVGLLGADYAAEIGRYRIQRILDSGDWNPDATARPARRGLNVNPENT